MPPKRSGGGARPAFKRARTAVGGGGAGGNPRSRIYKKSGPKSGMTSSYGKALTRPTVSKIERPFVKRNVRESHYDWQLVPAAGGMGNILTPINMRTPDLVWGTFTQGFDVSQTTSLLLKSRNVMCNMRFTMPKTTTAVQPYQFRIVQGFVKSGLTGLQMDSTVGSSGMQDGIHFNFQPNSAFDNYCLQVLSDSTGVQLGDADYTGAIDRRRVHIIEDQFMTVVADTVDTNGYMVYRNPIKVCNWKTNTKMRLYATTQNAGPGVPNPGDVAWCPINNPDLWTPFVAVILQNNTDYTVDADKPRIDYTWTHYWTDC